MRLFTSKYCEFALGARTFIHSGRRGRSATGSDLSIATSLETVVPEAPLEKTENGLVPAGEGWFVLNARDAALVRERRSGSTRCSTARRRASQQVGINIGILRPGEPNSMYHGEDAQEDFLVLSGECLLIVEGEERPLGAWDFVHCPAWTSTSSSGPVTGRASCSPSERAARAAGFAMPVNEIALQHGAGVEEETSAERRLRALCRGHADLVARRVPAG